MLSTHSSTNLHYYSEGGSKVLVVFLDASKAFDTVEHSILFSELLQRGVCPVVAKYLYVSYQMSKVAVKWNGKQSEFFSLNNSVKQGSVVSPILFAVCLNPLIETIRACKAGYQTGTVSTNVFG